MREKEPPVLGTRLKERRFFRTLPTALKAEQPPQAPPIHSVGGPGHKREAAPPGQINTQRNETHSPDLPQYPASVPGREAP